MNDDRYNNKMMNMESILYDYKEDNSKVAREYSFEEIYGRNLLDKKYDLYMKSLVREQEIQEEEINTKMNFISELSIVKSKAMLLLEDELIVNITNKKNY
jgi:hypothetical protein